MLCTQHFDLSYNLDNHFVMKYILSFSLLFCFFLVSTTTTAAQEAGATQVSALKMIVVKVTGVGCNADIGMIGNEVEKLEGVQSCNAAKRGAVTRFVVQFDPAIVSEDAIYEAVEDTPGCKDPNDRPYRVKL